MSTYELEAIGAGSYRGSTGIVSGVLGHVTELGSESIAPESTNVSVSVLQSRRTALPRSEAYHHELPDCQLFGGRKALRLDFVCETVCQISGKQGKKFRSSEEPYHRRL